MKKTSEDLPKTPIGFQAFLSTAEILRQPLKAPAQTHLSGDRFCLYSGGEESRLGRKRLARLAHGGYKTLSSPECEPEEVTVLIERQDVHNREADEVEKTTIELAQMLDVSVRQDYIPSPAGGIMLCLGYRTRPNLELISRVPSELAESAVTTLQDLLADHQLKSTIPAVERFQVAYDIAAAVAVVHAARLVHKSIRLDTVNIFQTTTDEQTPQLRSFLSEWRLLRSGSGVTSQTGSDAWTEDIYRNPRRQGLLPQRRYHMRHDVYSLGVTLLEFGLWEPLITWTDGQPALAPIYCTAAERLGCVMVDQDPASRMKGLLKPLDVQRTIVEISKTVLPERVDQRHVEIVQVCLQCVEQGIGGKPLTGDAMEVGDRFWREIVGPLLDLANAESE